MNCSQVEEKLVYYFYEELAADERARVEEHLAGCARCAQAKEELGRLRAALQQRPEREASPALLVGCREALEEALDREGQSWRALVRSWFVVPPGMVALRATTVLMLLAVGLSLGWTLRPRLGSLAPGESSGAVPAWVGSDLGEFHIRGISQVAPDPQTDQVRITVDAERQVTLEGSFDDPRIRQVLLYAVRDYENPGIRRDTLEALRGRGDHPSVRKVLLHALRHDPNPGVRIEVVEAVRGMAWGPDVRQALLEAVRKDRNPGVRVAAVGVLVEHADEEVLPIFQELAHEDENPYVRLQCAKAARERAQAQVRQK